MYEAHALLFFGFALDKDFVLPDFDKRRCQDNGCQWTDHWEEIYYLNKKGSLPNDRLWHMAVLKFVKESGIEILSFGPPGEFANQKYNIGDNRPEAMVVTSESIIETHRFAKVIPPLMIKPKWETQLRDFCDFMQIPYKNGLWYMGASP